MGSADQGYRGQLWYIAFPSGETHRVTNDLMDYQLCCLDLTQDGKTLVDTELTTVSDLWAAPARDAASAKQITVKEPIVGALSWTADGRIVFANGDERAKKKTTRATQSDRRVSRVASSQTLCHIRTVPLRKLESNEFPEFVRDKTEKKNTA